MFRIRRPRAIAAGALALGLAAAALSGCSASAAGDGGSATKGDITWWSWTPDNDLAAREIAAFKQQYPDIKVTYKKVPNNNYTAVLRPALASNDGPDVFTLAASGSVGPVQTFAPYALDLTAPTEKLLGSGWKSKLYAQGVDAFTVKGRYVAAPFAKVGAGIIWVNKNLFDKFGVTIPTTLDEWKAACQTFRANGLGCLQEGVNSGFDVDTLHSIADSVQPGFWANAVAGKAKWNDPTVVESLRIFGELATDGILDKGAVGIQQYPDVNNNFLSGKVPMVQMGTWYAQYTTVDSLTAALAGAGVAASTEKVTIVPAAFPDVAGKGNPSTLFADPDAAQAVNAKSKNRNAATTFALWLGGTEKGQQVVVNNLDSGPVLKGVQPAWSSIKLVDPGVQQPLVQKMIGDLQATTEARNLGVDAELNQAIINANEGAGREIIMNALTIDPETANAPSHRVEPRPSAGAPRRRGRRDRRAGLPWILPAMIVSVGLLYYCIGYTGFISTLDWDGASPIQTPVGADNYVKMFNDPVFWGSLWHTVVFFVAAFTVQVVLGMTFASLLHSKVYLKTVYKVLIFIPVVLSTATVAPVFRQIFAPDGAFNGILSAVGLGGLTQAWLANGTTALAVVIGVQIWQSTGVVFILYYAAMSQIDNEVNEAARLDGAGNLRIIVSIVWPGVKGTTIAIAILTAIGSLKTFDIPYLITTGGPTYATEFLGTMIYRVSVALSQVGYGAALSIVLLILAIGSAIVINTSSRMRGRRDV